MKKIILLVVLLPLIGFSQEGKPIKSIAIPSADLPKPDIKPETTANAPQYSISKPFEPKLFKVPPRVYGAPKEESKVSMTPKQSDLNVGKQFAEKINKANTPKKEGSEDPKAFRRNQYFGEYKTESATISISYRDFGEIDADRVRIWLDGKVVSDIIELEADTRKVYIGLLMGINHIEIEALNEGVYTPNTGEFGFFDENKQMIAGDKWGLATGFRATFNILRVERGALKNE
ncbi:hypothetical protein EQG63_10730 [Flavobacterium amnicola]|uniref:Uncharacterized protein n=1 Tax=Flavobacterium amnicola TaxID=2506422 RepID=A0A4Q1K0X7_9FLAO|nr:hypothetical protein [Flavobacterium amnicola]RXR17259.1 hypothetical protein EQG63_10730 [Flavobacterium amnicola]